MIIKEELARYSGPTISYSDFYDDKRLERAFVIKLPTIKKVIFNAPATIVLWSDNSKTVVKCQEGDIYDPEKGLAMAIAKKYLGNKGNYCEVFKKWLPKEEKVETIPFVAEVLKFEQTDDGIHAQIKPTVEGGTFLDNLIKGLSGEMTISFDWKKE